MTTTTTGPDLSHPIGPDGIVSIRVRDGDLRLRAVDGDVLRVRDRRRHDLESLFDIELGDGSASLFDRHGAAEAVRPRRGHAPDLELDLPRHATIVIETVSADIAVDGLQGDQRYQTTSGDLTLRAISGRLTVEAVSAEVDIRATGEIDVDARTVSGDIELRAGTLRSLRIATTSGDVMVAGQMSGPGPFALETVSGDVRIAPAGDVRIEMATMSGDLHSEIGGQVEGGRGRKTLVLGSSGQLVTFRSMSGDLNVTRPVPVAPPAPVAPSAPSAPAAPLPPESAEPPAPPSPTNGAIAAAYDDARLGILRSLERGEIDVVEASRRFEALDGGETSAPVPEPTQHATDPASETTRVPVIESDGG